MQTEYKLDENLFYHLVKVEIIENIKLLLNDEVENLLKLLAENEPVSITHLFGILLGVPDDEVSQTIEELYQESYVAEDVPFFSSNFYEDEE